MADTEKRTFRDFHVSLLHRGNVKDEHIELFLSDKNMAELKKAFTHPSYDPVNNFEMYELLGDGTINEFVPYYTRDRFPRIVSVKWLTRIKHNLVGGKQLAIFARKEGLEEHILYGEEVAILKAKAPKDVRHYKAKKGKKNDYFSVLEDVMEAYFGCLTTIIQNSGKSHGVAVQISHNILRSFFDVEEISTKYEDVFDAISRLKELYESKKRGFKWPNDQAYVVTSGGYGAPTASFKADVYGWPRGDKKPEDKNKVLLATATAEDKDEAKQKAATKALAILDSSYGIKEFASDPYER
jgi:dsRNA-specific ribonuclease